MEDKEISKETQEKITQLQMMEQALQNSVLQKQQFNAQLLEIDSALKELGATEKAYKIVGNIMINAEKQDLEKDLNKKKETIELRVQTLEKQEQRFQEKAKAMQEEVMKTIKE